MQITNEVTHHYLYAGSIQVSRKPIEIQTVLGSCVSVCLFDIRNNVGGMNHYMLPIWKGDGLATAKYGNIAIERLLQKMLTLGTEKKHIIAKVFGGADRLGDDAVYGIGKKNIQIAEDQLAAYNIPIVSSNIGGTVGRKVLFKTGSGLVYMKFVND